MTQGGRKPEIHNLCPLVPKIHVPNLKRIEAVVIKKKLKMFKC
jgi:hypothetical protein